MTKVERDHQTADQIAYISGPEHPERLPTAYLGMSTTSERGRGWYAVNLDAEGNVVPASRCESRRWTAEVDAHDCGASHVGYGDGEEWELVYPADMKTRP